MADVNEKNKQEVEIDFFINDLTPEARHMLEEIIGTDHNYDVLPLFTYTHYINDEE